MTTTLVVCEKPDAARRIAKSLSDESKAPRDLNKDIPVYEIVRDGERILVCSAMGHLYSVDQKGAGRRGFPIWDLTWKPRHLLDPKQQRLRTWIKQIRQISLEADRFVNACDFDIEGSVIGATILRYTCNGADRRAKRMKFSTLTKRELEEAYANLTNELDYPLINSGMCRHEVDWIYGVNLSRVLTNWAHQYGGTYSTLSTGRVQGPTLRFIVDREKEISCFVPTPYWTIETTIEVQDHSVSAQYQKERIGSRDEAEKVIRECSGKEGRITDIESLRSKIPPPLPFDLSALQAEAYRHFGLRPSHTLGIAERLYLDALISYPRTSSQKLPPSIEYRKILEALSTQQQYQEEIEAILKLSRLFPQEGEREDPAHPAIYPTGNIPGQGVGQREHRIYDVIVRRFMAAFGEAAVRESKKATISVEGYSFYLRGIQILAKGWIDLYEPYSHFEEILLPALNIGDRAKVTSILIRDKFTQPSPRFNPSSLLKVMESHNIGTKATRAEIVETLYRRGYVIGERMTATPLAFGVIETLTRYCPKVIDTDLTRELEEKMQDIESGENTRELVLMEAIDHLRSAITQLKARASEIGAELGNTIRETRMARTVLISKCPKCSSTLTVVRNKRTGKRFIGCTGRWERNCTFSLPLPQLGKLTLLEGLCSKCGFQLVQTRMTARRPMISCPKCFSESRGK